MDYLQNFLESQIKPDNYLVFLLDMMGNLKYLKKTKNWVINKKIYEIHIFFKSNLSNFYRYFENRIRHKELYNRKIIILSNDTINEDKKNLDEKLPFYYDFLTKRAKTINFDINEFLIYNFKIKTSLDELLHKSIEWYCKNHLSILKFRSQTLKVFDIGIQEITEPQRYLQYIQDALFKMFEEYPQMALPLIDIKLYAKFINDHETLIEEHKTSIIQQLQFKIRRHTKGERFSPSNLALALSKILFEILTNSTVLSLDLS